MNNEKTFICVVPERLQSRPRQRHVRKDLPKRRVRRRCNYKSVVSLKGKIHTGSTVTGTIWLGLHA